MKTYADTVAAAHELQTHFALRATSEERSAYSTTRIIREGETLYKETIFLTSNIPTYSIAINGGKWERTTAAEVYASLCQI